MIQTVLQSLQMCIIGTHSDGHCRITVLSRPFFGAYGHLYSSMILNKNIIYFPLLCFRNSQTYVSLNSNANRNQMNVANVDADDTKLNTQTNTRPSPPHTNARRSLTYAHASRHGCTVKIPNNAVAASGHCDCLPTARAAATKYPLYYHPHNRADRTQQRLRACVFCFYWAVLSSPCLGLPAATESESPNVRHCAHLIFI